MGTAKDCFVLFCILHFALNYVGIVSIFICVVFLLVSLVHRVVRRIIKINVLPLLA